MGGIDRRKLRELKEAPWTSVEELKAFVAEIVPASKKDVEAMLEALHEVKSDAQNPRHKNRCSALRAVCSGSTDPALFGPLAQHIVKADPLLRRTIAAVLPRVNDVARHGLLCAALGSPDPDARATAAAVLAQVGGPSALRELTKYVEDPSYAGRRDALEVMVPKARHRALDLIATVLRVGSPQERLRALELASDAELMGGAIDAAISVVVSALDDPDRRVSAAAFEAFASLADEETFVQALEPRMHADDVSPVLVEALGHVASERSIALLQARLRRGPVAVQLAVINALRRIGSDACVPGLVEALHYDEASIRRNASEALTELGSSERVDMARLLLALLASPHAHVRRTATHLAGSIKHGTAELTDRLLSALRNEDWWVRERVLDAIVEIGLPELALGLVPMLRDENPVIRRFAIFGLLRLRDPATLGAILRTAVTDDDWWVREQAVQAAGELGDDRAVPYLRALVQERWDLKVASLEALSTLGAEETLLELAELTADPDPAVRLAIVELLAKLPNGRKAGFYVQAAVNDAEPRVAKLARSLLDRWKLDAQSEGSSAVGLLDRLLVATARHGADDLLISPGRPPYVKHLGSVAAISKSPLTQAEMERMILPILSDGQRAQLVERTDVDLSYDVPGFDLRYRINVFRQIAGLSAVFRRIHQVVPQLDALGLPPVVKTFADYPNGLVLVGGPTGSGKSTTLAALIDYINTHHGRHIITIEDPIEVLHAQRESLINQREVGTHAATFASALRATLRQDPDVILVGELRDRETIEFAVNAAETGHLVFATVHTTSAATSVDRLIHACEAARQPVIRSMLAETLRAVLCQQLLRRAGDESRRVLACEVLLNNDAVGNLVRKDKSFQLPSVMTTHGEIGMKLMDVDLQRLVKDRIVDPDEAMMKAFDKANFAAFAEAFKQGKDPSSLPPRPVDSFSSEPPTGLKPSRPPLTAGRMSFAPPPASARPTSGKES